MIGNSIGSGTIIDPDGTILTCAHVVVDLQSTRRDFRGKVNAGATAIVCFVRSFLACIA